MANSFLSGQIPFVTDLQQKQKPRVKTITKNGFYNIEEYRGVNVNVAGASVNAPTQETPAEQPIATKSYILTTNELTYNGDSANPVQLIYDENDNKYYITLAVKLVDGIEERDGSCGLRYDVDNPDKIAKYADFDFEAYVAENGDSDGVLGTKPNKVEVDCLCSGYEVELSPAQEVFGGYYPNTIAQCDSTYGFTKAQFKEAVHQAILNGECPEEFIFVDRLGNEMLRVRTEDSVDLYTNAELHF